MVFQLIQFSKYDRGDCFFGLQKKVLTKEFWNSDVETIVDVEQLKSNNSGKIKPEIVGKYIDNES